MTNSDAKPLGPTPVKTFGAPRPLPKTPLPPLDPKALAESDRVAEAVGFPSREPGPRVDNSPAERQAQERPRRVRPRAEPMQMLNMRISETEFARFVEFANEGPGDGQPFSSYRAALMYLLDRVKPRKERG